jgi:hypothetical protein
MQVYKESGGNNMYVKKVTVDKGVMAIISIEDIFNLGSEMQIKLTKKQAKALGLQLLSIANGKSK